MQALRNAATGLMVAMVVVSTAYAASDPAATDAIRAAIVAKLPSATQLFVNCPSNNTLPTSDGSTAIACEFRAIDGGIVIHGGSATATLVNGQWQASDVLAGDQAPNRWGSCRLGGLGGHSTGQTPRKLRVHGTPCFDARFLTHDIGALALGDSGLRIPRHFKVAWYGTNTVGFVTNTFACKGRVRVRHPRRGNPFGRETARCRTIFGDRFLYVFDQHS
jgi:hypothetical protein